MQLFLVFQAGLAASSRGGASYPGSREREGGQAGRDGKDAGAGAQSLRAEPRSGRGARERGLGHGLLAVGGISWPRQSDHKGGCGREPPGAAGGRTEAATLRLGVGDGGVGWGGDIPGRAAASSLRLLKSKQLPGWCGAPSLIPGPPPAPCPLPGASGSFTGVERNHVLKFLRARNFSKLQSATKGKRARAPRSLSTGRAAGPDARGTCRPSARSPRLSLSFLP